MARVYGRVLNSDGSLTWTEVDTDSTGNSEYVYLTWLIQVLKLVTGESPFYANWGIPAVQSVVTQVQPNYYVWQTQQQFQSYFSSLVISAVPGTVNPTYLVNVSFFNGTQYQVAVDADNVQM
jgi:hypothetical protein